MLQLHSLHAYCQQKLLQVYNFRGKRLSLSLSLSHTLNLSYYLSCILFLFGSLLLCILLLLLFFVLSLKFFPLHVANCHDLRPVPLNRVSVHAAHYCGQQIVPIFGTIFCPLLLRICFQLFQFFISRCNNCV